MTVIEYKKHKRKPKFMNPPSAYAVRMARGTVCDARFVSSALGEREAVRGAETTVSAGRRRHTATSAMRPAW